MINFYLENSFEDINKNTEVMGLDEDLHVYLNNNITELPFGIAYLVSNSPHCDQIIIEAEDIQLIKDGCDEAIQYLPCSAEEEQFFVELFSFCKKALGTNKKMIIIGD